MLLAFLCLCIALSVALLSFVYAEPMFMISAFCFALCGIACALRAAGVL